MEQRELSYMAGRSIERQFFIKLNIYPPYTPAVVLLGIYLREMKTYIHKKKLRDTQNK